MKVVGSKSRGFTVIELLVTAAVLGVLAAAIMPIAKNTVKREKEIELRRNLRLIRDTIDVYKKMADEKKFDFDADTMGYPPDLETLVKGVELKGGTSEPGGKLMSSSSGEKKIFRFLRRIPKDPFTNSTEWGLRSNEDDPDADVWGGKNVYDVYTKSKATALDDTKYRDW